MYTIAPNPEFNSVEVLFYEKPDEAVRNALKGLRFRWHSVKKIWYGYASIEDTKKAIDDALAGNPVVAPAKVKKAVEKAVKKAVEKTNEYGVKVGDVFKADWGYDQTNVDWFQVVELVGKSSARIVEVYPECVGRGDCGPMYSNKVYRLTAEPMMKVSRSIHIKDNEKGDLKRIKKCGNSVYFNMASYANAYLTPHGDIETYESYYA